jgi:hypothetical protein
VNHTLQRAWQRALRRLGPAGLIGVALLLPALVIALAMPRLDQRADELRSALAAKADTMIRMAPPTRRDISTGEQVLEYVAGFPPLTQSSADLDKVFETAKRRNLALPKGEYQLKAEPNSPLVTYTATFPVRNEYAALKDFTADVLTALPHASMDELRMTRPDAASGVLDAVVRFTFVYRNQ